MKLKFLSVLCLALAVSFSAIAQHDHGLDPCGTQDGRVRWQEGYKANKPNFQRSPVTQLIPIKIHVVGRSNGTGHFPVKSIIDAFCTLNNDFVQADIQFFIDGDFHYINNDNWYEHNFFQGNQMMNQNNFSNTINCYIVSDPAGACGYSNYARGIALAKNCISPSDHTWAHEVGHYLSLDHTFYGWEGSEPEPGQPAPTTINGEVVEKMDGSNCSYAADGFCDTAPDYLSDRWNCNNDSLSNTVQLDPNGEEFRSDGTLFMSYANDGCSSRFSEEQIDAMHANLMFERSNLLDQADEILPPDEDVFTVISPAPEEFVNDYQNVLFEWEPVPDATGYIVEATFFEDFSAVFFRYAVESNSFVANDLYSDKTYYWRVQAYNEQHTCTDFMEVNTFSTGTLSAVQNIDAVSDLIVSPNPVRQGGNSTITLQATESMQLEGVLLSATGQAMRQFPWQVTTGLNRMELETTDLPAGLYFLQLRSEQEVVSRKVVLQ